ncbi:hypothetical protein Hypma_008624 [Hypsizygus marmoreus]|uniref:F-box domain-containing protein n=1 Tax=Hypsizygus marmoreus TaxID=39966 RepID=A0A369JSE0_HYPMA|nr:hypothetical protein Hypma_008624 [Hypsizygus marmoreus]
MATVLKAGGLLGSLPVDLKREILETIAYVYPHVAPRLTLVSRDVQRWIEQIIYREIFLMNNHHLGFFHSHDDGANSLTLLQKFTRTMETRPASFFADHVKTLHFDGPFVVATILSILKVCTGVTNLGCYARIEVPEDQSDTTTEPVYRAIHTLPLQRLFISQENLDALLQVDVSDSLLKNVTHLAVVDGWNFHPSRFPNLTHLAVIPDVDGRFATYVKQALANTQIVSVVAMLNYVNSTKTSKPLQELKDSADPRFVVFTLPLSEKRFIEDDLWDLAMEFPDEDQPVAYLDEIPGPRLLSFAELSALGL